MKFKKPFFIIIAGLIIACTTCFIALASIDAPHNESNNVNCGSCHGQGLLDSPFWGGNMSFDDLCTNCHKVSSGPYTPTNAPLAKTHSSANTSEQYGVWSWECRNCHDPHYQKQKLYKNTDANVLYLATGTIVGCADNGNGTSTLSYSSITYKDGWDEKKLTEKTNTYRRVIIFPNVGKLGYSYPVTSIDDDVQEITVTGDATPVYQYISSSTFAMIYGQYVKDSIDNNQVKLFNRKDSYSCADGDTIYDGVCEICHTQTLYHRQDGSGNPHYPAVRCSICHSHTGGFADTDHTGGSGSDCDDCHGHDDGWAGGNYFGTVASHSTHTETDSDDVKGPLLDCDVCHDTYNYPYFKSGTDSNADGKYDLSETDVCDVCHSPSGSYDGVSDAEIGAKNNWDVGVYSSPDLKAGKEKWCAGCHDEEPANSKYDDSGIDAPNVIGDEDAATQYGTGYGFYKTGHGLSTGSYPASGGSAANANCTDCHNAAYAHIDHDSRTYSASANNYQAGYRLKYSMDIPRNDTGMPKSDFELCGKCHDLDQFLNLMNLTTNLRGIKTSGTSTDLSETILTDSTKAWGVNNFVGSVLIPNIEKPWKIYRVTSNTETTITVSGSMLSDGAQTGDNYWVDVNSHRTHLQSWQAGSWNPYGNCGKWDSDYDNAHICSFPWEASIFDSTISCPTCHNVHGSKLARMTRDGTLVSGRSLGFYYVPPYSYPNSTTLPNSDGGRWSQNVCGPCHSSSGTYSRVAKGTVIFSSDADQYFSVADPPTAISTITITDNPRTATISPVNDIRIRIPENFNMTWDTTDVTATMGGSASGKVDSTVSFPDNKTLLIDVTSDFAAGDTLTIDDLSFTNFTAISDPDNLELYIDGGHVLNTEDTKTILIGTKAILSSAADQTFAIGDWSTEISPITIRAITDGSDINTVNDIRIKIPSPFPMDWDTSDLSAIISGSASAKVNTTVSYPDEKTLLIDVTADFNEGDEITIAGLQFSNFYVSASPDNLELYVDGPSDTTADALDDKTITIEDMHWMSPVNIVRGYCSDEMGCYDTLVDGNLNTGNLWPGGNGILDLGKEYLVTHIRVYARLDKHWHFRVGNTLTDCLSDGIDVTGKWRTGYDGGRWYEREVTQTTGRYIRIQYDDVGGWPADNTLMEVEFAGIPLDNIVMSSSDKQEFEVGQDVTEISPITITDSSPSPSITASDDIRIVIPSSLYMSWDTSDTVATIGGTASGKVNSTISYPDDKTLLIDVTSNFTAGDTLTVEGLSFKDFAGQSYEANLGLSVDGGTSLATTDPKTIRIWDWISPVDVVEGYGTSIVKTENLTNITLTLAGQPSDPSYLSVRIVDTTPSITNGIVTITGTTAEGPGQTEDIDCSAGTGTYIGNKVFEMIDSIVTVDFANLDGGGDETIAVGTPDCCNLNNSRYLVDNKTSTGNTPWGGSYVIYDLGDTYTVTAIRMFTTVQFGWNVYVGDSLAGCSGTWGTQVKSSWTSPGDSAWHATAIEPGVSGRYIKINALWVGGGLPDGTIREFDFQGYKTSENRHLTISSSADQTFEKDQTVTLIQPINIKYYPTNGTITAANDILINIPASFNMEWDTTDTSATIGGSAASKVSSTVSYPDARILLINVTQDFSAGDTLIISGLSFDNFTDQSFKDHLQLSIDGGSTVAATDSKYIWVIHWQTPSIVYSCTTCVYPERVVDGNTATGNSTWGPIVFDLGESKPVRFIRVWANGGRRWTSLVGDDLASCGTDWPSPKSGWYPANGQWSETPVLPVTGQYMRFYIDFGGPIGENTIMEFQYQAW